MSLALPWSWWGVWRFYGKHIPPLWAALTSVWVFLLLAVIHTFTGGGWLVRSAYPLAALGVVFLWAYLLCLRYLPNPWFKAGGCALLTAAASPAFGWLCRRVIPDPNQPLLLDHFIFAALLAPALALLAVGAGRELKQRRRA